MVPYFCGDMPICEEPSDDALNIAKINAEHKFLVVGLTERFTELIDILEAMLPKYFDGLKIHNNIISGNLEFVQSRFQILQFKNMQEKKQKQKIKMPRNQRRLRFWAF